MDKRIQFKKNSNFLNLRVGKNFYGYHVKYHKDHYKNHSEFHYDICSSLGYDSLTANLYTEYLECLKSFLKFKNQKLKFLWNFLLYRWECCWNDLR